MSTLKVGSGEVIAKMHPLPTDEKMIRRYRQALGTTSVRYRPVSTWRSCR